MCLSWNYFNAAGEFRPEDNVIRSCTWHSATIRFGKYTDLIFNQFFAINACILGIVNTIFLPLIVTMHCFKFFETINIFIGSWLNRSLERFGPNLNQIWAILRSSYILEGNMCWNCRKVNVSNRKSMLAASINICWPINKWLWWQSL